MAVEPMFETINYNCGKKVLKEQIKVECRADLSTDEISSLLNVSSFAVVTHTEARNGKLDYVGTIIFYVSFIGLDGKLSKMECGSEFKGSITGEEITEQSRISANVIVDKAFADLSGAKLNLNAYLTFNATVISCAQISLLSGGENLVVNEGEVNYLKSCGLKTLIFPLEEEFQVAYAVKEVLSHRAEAVITSVQCGVGCIIVDGEVLISAIMLLSNDRNDIIKEVKKMPFRAEIECEEAMPNMQAVAKVKEKSFKTNVSVDENGGESEILISVNLEFEGEAFYNESLTIATDAFSVSEEVELTKKEMKYLKTGEQRSASVTINGRSATEELPVGAVVLAVGGEKAEIIKVSCDDNLTLVTGTLTATAYMREGDGKVFTVTLETPFETALDFNFPCNADLDIIVKAGNGRARIVSLTETELEAELIFTVYPEEQECVNFIGEVKAIGEKKNTDSALSVYIPTKGEDMWSLAKRLNVCPKSLAETNPELQFPLTGNERIVVYRQR